MNRLAVMFNYIHMHFTGLVNHILTPRIIKVEKDNCPLVNNGTDLQEGKEITAQ